MFRNRIVLLITAAPAAFLASSVWYSPLLFGLQFAALSGVNSNTASNGGKIGLAFRADFCSRRGPRPSLRSCDDNRKNASLAAGRMAVDRIRRRTVVRIRAVAASAMDAGGNSRG